MLTKLPEDAIIEVVTNGVPRNTSAVRDEWSKFRFLHTDKRTLGGWGAAVLLCVREMVHQTQSPVFSLDEIYMHSTNALAEQYPNNNNVKAKIRQQLQVLRDAGILTFLTPGHYEIVG